MEDKKMKTSLAIITFVWTVISAPVLVARTKLPEPGVALTVYNRNFAVVKERRYMDFTEGLNTVKFTDVASAIDPTSVNFKSLSAPDAVSVLEQNYEYDLVNTASLLKRYIDRMVTVHLKGSGADTGTTMTGLLSAAVGKDLILGNDSGGMDVVSMNSIEHISLTQVPDDLVTKPTLIWLAQAARNARHLCQVTYTTERIEWKADYSALLNEKEDALDLTGWVTIDNKSGAAYKDAIIKLIAGDVRRVQDRPVPRQRMYKMAAMDEDALGAGFEEKAFMEYHIYTLGRKSTINNNQVKQIELITPATDVPVKKLYIYERQKNPKKVQVKLEFENKKQNRLGIALPKGKVRVFKKDPADGTLEFVGEDLIDHTAKDEKVSLYIGDAFDIVPEYTLTDSKHARRRRVESHKIELRNRKEEPVTVFVDEKFPAHVNWNIDDTNVRFKKRDAQTARFEVTLKADSVRTVEYTATQTW